jgi:hypothetical protein
VVCRLCTDVVALKWWDGCMSLIKGMHLVLQLSCHTRRWVTLFA